MGRSGVDGATFDALRNRAGCGRALRALESVHLSQLQSNLGELMTSFKHRLRRKKARTSYRKKKEKAAAAKKTTRRR